MRKYCWPLIACLVFISCKKNKGAGLQNTSNICFDTAFIKTNINEVFQTVFFTDGKTGFTASSAGNIYKTTDSAKTWNKLNSPVNVPIFNLYFLDANTGFAIGGQDYCYNTGCVPAGGFILKTTDGGQTWSRVFTPSDKITLVSIYFTNDSVGFCVGGNTICKTIDGGNTWNETKLAGANIQMKAVKFADAQKGYIACLQNKIIKTDNGGTTWSVINMDKNINTANYTLSLVDGSLVISGNVKIIKSLDEGVTWNELPNSPAKILAMYFVNSKIGYALGTGNTTGGDFPTPFGAIYCTDNGGVTWNGSPDITQTLQITSVSFPSANLGYAVSYNRVVKLTTK